MKGHAMEMKPLPYLLSPNLGCPVILSVSDIKRGLALEALVACECPDGSTPTRHLFDGRLELVSSYPEEDGGGRTTIPMEVKGDPEEVTDWNVLPRFQDADDTRWVLGNELVDLFGDKTRFFKVCCSFDKSQDKIADLLDGAGSRQKMFDLVFEDPDRQVKRTCLHSVVLLADLDRPCRFIHLTDIHAALRNDEILAEVTKERSKRQRQEIVDGYINFNENFRKFIQTANEKAVEGELDFVVITGDLVDFAHHGWELDSCPPQNNWQVFIDLVTGGGSEKRRGNEGLRVPVFTSLGNHDWRLHPYDPRLGSFHDTFGLTREEMKKYPYRSFDSSSIPDEERAKRSKELARKGFNLLNIEVFADRWKIRLARFFSKIATRWTLLALSTLGAASGGLTYKLKDEVVAFCVFLAFIVVWAVQEAVRYGFKRLSDLLVSNPLNAGPLALHYYLKHINPYLDLAFSFGRHTFILMDTGSDIFVGDLLDGKEVAQLKRMSFKDNILGGSPDSRAFDARCELANWSQIAWLERVLEAVEKEKEGRIFIMLHAPPINTDKSNDYVLAHFEENKRKEPRWIDKKELNLTYGSISHYLSQFFYLCLGTRESRHPDEPKSGDLHRVDMVFAGHAHRNIEFRMDMDSNGRIRIYSDRYSSRLSHEDAAEFWEGSRPVMVQTAACGPRGGSDKNPPYYRLVTINEQGLITGFDVFDGKNESRTSTSSRQ